MRNCLTTENSEPINVQALLLEIRDGNHAVIGRLLESYSSYLAVLARIQIGRRLRGKADPLDIVQEVFLDAHRQMLQFRGTSYANRGTS